MAQDYAKKRKPSAGQKKPAPRRRKSPSKPAREPISALRWYSAGIITGVILCFLMYLGTLPAAPGTPGAATEADLAAAIETEPPKPRFDFYTLLPQQTIDVEVDPGEIAKTRTNPTIELYILQAGSFRQREDADRRRAELLLLSLDPKVEETSGDNGRWFRVYVGPFESRSAVAKARGLTAAQNIDTLLLKRSKP